MKTVRLVSTTRRGFTLIEIMVVVIVLGILAAVIIPNFAGNTDKARVAKTQSDISDISTLLEQFRLDMRRYPTEDEGLGALRQPPTTSDANLWKGPYTNKDIPNDPWGNPYHYYSPCPNDIDAYGVESLGSDGQSGGEGLAADINSWTKAEEK